MRSLVTLLTVLGLLPFSYNYAFAADIGNITVNDSTPWPASNPFPAALSAEVAACQTKVGVYDPIGVTRWFDLSVSGGYDAMKAYCLTGVAWFKDTTATGNVENKGTSTKAVVPPTPAPVTVAKDVKLGECAAKSTREARLDCATAKYFEAGSGLAGLKAYMTALGVTYDDVKVGDPWQPDADPLPSGSPRIWGMLVKATNLKVTGNSCLVTDVPSRIANFGWAMVDDRYAPRPSVWHAGEATTGGSMTEIALHGDCSDWPEVVEAMTRGGEYHPYTNGAVEPSESVAAPETGYTTSTAGCLMSDGNTVPNDYTVVWADGREQVCKAGQLVDPSAAQPSYTVAEPKETGPSVWQRLTSWPYWPWVLWPLGILALLALLAMAVIAFVQRNNETADAAARRAAAQRRRPAPEAVVEEEQPQS